MIRHIQVMLGDLEEGPELKEKFAAIGWDTVENLMPQLKERAKTLVELVDNARFLIAERPLSLDEKAAKLLDGDARAHLGALRTSLAACEPWTVEAIEAVVRDFTKANDLKLGKVAQPLRAALTGRTASLPIFDVVAILPKEEALGRLDDVSQPS